MDDLKDTATRIYLRIKQRAFAWVDKDTHFPTQVRRIVVLQLLDILRRRGKWDAAALLDGHAQRFLERSSLPRHR